MTSCCEDSVSEALENSALISDDVPESCRSLTWEITGLCIRVIADLVFCPVWTTQTSEGAGAAFCHRKKYK